MLLVAIRSPRIVPELRAIAFDNGLDTWLRIHALRAIASTPGDIACPEFEPLAQQALTWRAARARRFHQPNPDWLLIGIDLLDDLASLADNHPVNRGWFLAVFDGAQDLREVQRFLRESMNVYMSDAFRKLLLARLLALLEAHPDLLDLETVSALQGTEHTQAWLDARFDRVFALCLAASERQARTVFYLAADWERLRQALSTSMLGFAADLQAHQAWIEAQCKTHGSQEGVQAFRASPAYLTLERLFEAARDGDRTAYDQLGKIARWNDSILLRAVATHFLGRLHPQYDVQPILISLLFVDDDWNVPNSPDSPVRYEAGVALLDLPSPETWIALVDSFFVNPRNILQSFQREWIAYVTDRLSGVDGAYHGLHYGGIEKRPWFRALVDIPAEQIEGL